MDRNPETAAAHERPSLSGRRVVVVADPFPVSRDAVASLLRTSGAVDCAYGAESLETALAAVRRVHADMLVTDVDLTGCGEGVRLCHQVKRLARPPSVLMFTGVEDPAVVAACLAAGADGFVHRSASPDRLVHAVETLGAGRSVWFLRDQAARTSTGAGALRVSGMTTREQEVLGLLLGRLSNEEIAAELNLARQTVKNHVSNVLHKVGVSSRRDLLLSVDSVAVPA